MYLFTRYLSSDFVKYFFRRSADTPFKSLFLYSASLALAIAASEISVANSWMAEDEKSLPRYSCMNIISEYASSPVEQPAIQILKGSLMLLFFSNAGIIVSSIVLKMAGSRKNCVTGISRSWNRMSCSLWWFLICALYAIRFSNWLSPSRRSILLRIVACL